MSLTLIFLKALIGGLAVVAFSLIAQAGHPKRFAGLFSAAPSVAFASLGITVITKRAEGAVPYAGHAHRQRGHPGLLPGPAVPHRATARPGRVDRGLASLAHRRRRPLRSLRLLSDG